ncbi:MAG: hypothetical protein IPP64_10055 [Bacteroidetes bacterium]|nr:hypothetical protein [Bacteroidota bacterium]
MQTDALGTEQKYSIFQNGIYGSPQAGKSGLIGFNLNNSIEAKIRQHTDSGNVDKKISLLESFNIGMSYNLAAENFNWSSININGRTRLFNRLDINATALIDPYQIDSIGNRIESLNTRTMKIGRITNSNVSLSKF